MLLETNLILLGQERLAQKQDLVSTVVTALWNLYFQEKFWGQKYERKKMKEVTWNRKTLKVCPHGLCVSRNISLFLSLLFGSQATLLLEEVQV